jgi:DNA-binding NarL/FixJ family response regulator
MRKVQMLISAADTARGYDVRRILEEHTGWQIDGEVDDAHQTMRHVITFQPDVAIIDIRIPMLGGIEVAREIVRRAPNVGLVILNDRLDGTEVIQALRAGAKGYVLKDGVATELIRAVSAVLEGKLFFSSAVRPIVDDCVRCLAEKVLTDHHDVLADL